MSQALILCNTACIGTWLSCGVWLVQRLLAVMPQLEFAVRRCGAAFADYLSCLPACSEQRLDELQTKFGPHYTSPNHLSEVRPAMLCYACLRGWCHWTTADTEI